MSDKLTEQDYQFICQFVKKVTGIGLDLTKIYLIDSRLSKYISSLDFSGSTALVKHLHEQPYSPLSIDFAHSLLTHETLFFRGTKHYIPFFKNIIPNFLSGQRLSIWSAACSSGQEPYSISMSLSECAEFSNYLNAKILATDISPKMIDYASRGCFSTAEVNRGVNPVMLQRYFKSIDTSQWLVCEQIKHRIQFQVLNLMDPIWPLPKFNLVYLCNVLIYFDPDDRKKILNSVKKHLEIGGIIVTGTGENVSSMTSDLKKYHIEDTIFFVRTK